MFNTVYKTTNIVNGKFYIGVHSTVDINDNYFGSGTALKYAIQKYGIDNFKKEVLYVFDTIKECYEKENELVTEELVINNLCYNMKIGGYGGIGLKHSDATKQKISISKIGYKHSDKAKQKMSDATKGSQIGTKNNNYNQGHKQKGINNGRHHDNYNGDMDTLSVNISKGLVASGTSHRSVNQSSKKFYVYDTITNSCTDIDKGYLKDFCKVFSLNHLVLRTTLKTNKPLSKGVGKGYQLFEGTYE